MKNRSYTIDITRATYEDLDQIMALVQACVAHMRASGIDQWDELYPTRSIFEQDLTDGTLWVLREGAACRAIMVLNEEQAPEYGAVPWRYQEGPVLVVHRLAVDPVAQGQGFATYFMDFAEGYARSHRYKVVRLDAFPPNSHAIALYANRGYRKAGEIQFRKGVFYVFEKEVTELTAR